MVKLEAVGVKGNLLRWIEDWLAGKKQGVVVKGESSYWILVESGVPQGSVLGGPLFDIYIDYIYLAVLIAFLRKFADNIKMVMLIRSKEDADRLQEDINNICKWAND